MVEKTKDVESIYIENSLIANKILESKGHLTNLVNTLGSTNSFVLQESALHSLEFITPATELELKKAISTFEGLKKDLNLAKYKG